MLKRRLFLLCVLFVLPMFAGAALPSVQEWPLKIEGARMPILLYQPQPETFEDNKLTGRAAVSIQQEGKAPVFGAVWIEARIETDRDKRTVTVEDVQIPRTRFPGAPPEKEKVFSSLLAEALTKKNFVISLDRLLTSLENAKKNSTSVEGLKNDPPRIYVEKSDALLLILDGEPQLRPIKDSSDQRVVNTLFDLTFTKDKKWRLKLEKRQLAAWDLNGPWLDEVNTSAAAPKVIIAKEPAELIVLTGEPVYTEIPGIDLKYISNTQSHVFVEPSSSKVFVLLSGRWFTAPTLNGPWTFIRPDELPPGFAKIPADSPKGIVRASVSGTEEANEALLDALIPQTAVVSRKEMDGKLKVTWDGKPQFKELEGLSVSYSINASVPVFRVGKEGYWACTDGIWYASKEPDGPWLVASNVPKEIYQIPPSCPYYNCRYVYIYEAHPEVVYVGYYPGYVGSYPYYGTVVYGTGYDYAGWYGTSYYYPPVMMTWGFSYCYYPYYGWGGGAYYRPIGGYPGYGYGMRGDHVEHYGTGDRGQNIYNRANERGAQGSTQASMRGRGTPANTQPNARAGGAHVDSGDRANNVYADREGNVSRQNPDGTWQTQDKGGWKDTSSPQPDVQRDSQARDRGAQRAAQYQATSRPAYSGGGMRGSGRR